MVPPPYQSLSSAGETLGNIDKPGKSVGHNNLIDRIFDKPPEDEKERPRNGNFFYRLLRFANIF